MGYGIASFYMMAVLFLYKFWRGEERSSFINGIASFQCAKSAQKVCTSKPLYGKEKYCRFGFLYYSRIISALKELTHTFLFSLSREVLFCFPPSCFPK